MGAAGDAHRGEGESRAQLHRRVAESVRALRSEQGFRGWLGAVKRFHRYSLLNTLHIVCQRPDATYVAGYRTWQRLGYQVRGGERGIVILVPWRSKAVREDPDSGEDVEETRVYFRPGHVFDRSQVDAVPGKAEPLEPPAPAPVEGDTHAHLLDPLRRFAGGLGYKVVRAELPAGVEGLCERRERVVKVAPGQAPNAEVSVVVHELAHALMDGEELPRGREEALVECVAYVVCARAGLDVEANSVPYIAAWMRDDERVIERDASLVERMASAIERGIGLEAGAQGGQPEEGRAEAQAKAA